MEHCNVCGGQFYVEERWNGSKWRLVCRNEQGASPDDVDCAECPMYLPFEENIRDDEQTRVPVG